MSKWITCDGEKTALDTVGNLPDAKEDKPHSSDAVRLLVEIKKRGR